jgi:hypothetical protein
MSDLRRSGRKRTQTQFEAATETVAKEAGRTQAVQGIARRAREAAVADAFEPLSSAVAQPSRALAATAPGAPYALAA